ncbi:hypothetical protein PR048_017424 [Dryococelus australis]|uniref:HAT C-terminal dimerisation domain-containing protein n=1 Tax=Dryococelus australis TaxID=614101 RepID=A0ABQ9H9G8_9NEOP|nr:hypothetical protein PR048_017424 [Dryococelus australis]
MVWVAISYDSRTLLVMNDGSLVQFGNPISQKDNARPPIELIPLTYLADVNVLPWPDKVHRRLAHRERLRPDWKETSSSVIYGIFGGIFAPAVVVFFSGEDPMVLCLHARPYRRLSPSYRWSNTILSASFKCGSPALHTGRWYGVPLTAQSVTTLPWDDELLQLLKELVKGQQSNPGYQQLLGDLCAFLGPPCLTTYLTPTQHHRCYIVPDDQFLLPPYPLQPPLRSTLPPLESSSRSPSYVIKLYPAARATITLQNQVYVDSLGRLEVYFTFPVPLHSIKWGFMGIAGSGAGAGGERGSRGNCPPTRFDWWKVMLLVVLIMTVPASAASSERSFSVLRRLMTYLRATMKEKRLTHMMLLHVYKERTSILNLNDIMREFISRKDERKAVFGKVVDPQAGTIDERWLVPSGASCPTRATYLSLSAGQENG